METTGRYLEDFAVGQTFRSGRLQIDKERTGVYQSGDYFTID